METKLLIARYIVIILKWWRSLESPAGFILPSIYFFHVKFTMIAKRNELITKARRRSGFTVSDARDVWPAARSLCSSALLNRSDVWYIRWSASTCCSNIMKVAILSMCGCEGGSRISGLLRIVDASSCRYISHDSMFLCVDAGRAIAWLRRLGERPRMSLDLIDAWPVRLIPCLLLMALATVPFVYAFQSFYHLHFRLHKGSYCVSTIYTIRRDNQGDVAVWWL